MKKVNKLKDDARRHELREDWDKAIQAYQRVLELGESEGDVELPLYNRIGDLYVRVGKPNDAVRYYSQAADRYADAGLFNNAIALCNKALRYAPENLDLLRKLGQFSASQGFLTDARRWFLDYAENAARQNRVPEALQALEDFANSTEDAEVRELFGRTLQQHGKPEQALSELRHAYRMYLGADEQARAESLAAYLGEIAPEISLADEQPEAPHVRTPDDADYVIRPYATARETAAAEAIAEPAGDDAAAAEDVAPIPDDAAAAQEVEAGTLEGLEGTALGDADAETVEAMEADVLEGFQPTSFETEPEDEIAASDAERIETADAGEPDQADAAYELPGLEPTALGGAPEDDDVLDASVDAADAWVELPTLESDEAEAALEADEDTAGAFELPMLGGDEDDVALEAEEDTVGALELPTLEADEDVAAHEHEDTEAFELPELETDEAGEDQGAPIELPTFDDSAEDSAVVLPTFDDSEAAEPVEEPGPVTLPALDDAEPAVIAGDDAAATLPELDADAAADVEAPDVEFAVDEIELPLFEDTAAPVATEEPDAAAPIVESDEALAAAASHEDAPMAEPEAELVAEPEPAAEPAVVTEPQDVAFHPPVLSTDGTTTSDAEPPTVEIDRSGEAIASVIAAARSALGRDDVAGAVGRLLSLHQVLEDARAYGHAAEEVGALLIEKPREIRLHQVHVELAERSGDRTLRLGAYMLLARALEESNAPVKATAIYEHVLEIEPGHAAARDALDALERRRTSQYVDLKSLLELDTPSGETRYFVTEDSPTGDEDSDFAAVLSQFKAKLAEHVAPEDAEAHYDLGLAFKEMGLLDEAIEQFQVALRTGDGRLKVYEELGDCFVQKGEYSVAVKLLERALQIPAAEEMDRVGLYYYLGAASEQLGRADQARDAYERVLGLDMTFRDVAERLARL